MRRSGLLVASVLTRSGVRGGERLRRKRIFRRRETSHRRGARQGLRRADHAVALVEFATHVLQECDQSHPRREGRWLLVRKASERRLGAASVVVVFADPGKALVMRGALGPLAGTGRRGRHDDLAETCARTAPTCRSPTMSAAISRTVSQAGPLRSTACSASRWPALSR